MVLLLFLLLYQTPEDTYKAANTAFQAGHWEEAAAGYQKLLDLDPANIAGQFGLARADSKLGKDDKAEELYRAILKQNDGVFEAHMNLAALLARKNDTAGAAEQYEASIKLQADNAEARFAAGLFYFNTRDFQKAYQDFQAAEQHGIATAQLYTALSEAAHANKDEEKSRSYLEKAIEFDPQNKNLKHQLGIDFQNAGQYDKAIEMLKPLLPETRVELASCYFEEKDYKDALPLLVQLAAEQPDNADYLYFLGKTQKELKHYPEAIATLQKELQLRPEDADALSALGTSYLTLQDWSHAVIALEHFIKLRPQQAFAYYAAGISYDKLGNYAQALVHYNKFLEIDDGSDDAQSFQARERAKSLETLLKNKRGPNRL